MSMASSPETVEYTSPKQPVKGSEGGPWVDACRRLVANRYLKEGYVTPDQITPDGFINEDVDPYVEASDYFFSATTREFVAPKVVATSRQIYIPDIAPPEEWRFPVEKEFKLTDQAKEVIQTVKLNTPHSIREVSALAKEDETVQWKAVGELYRNMWQHSRQEDHELWVLAADENLAITLNYLFGQALVPAGEAREYMGSMTEPYLLFPKVCATAMAVRYEEERDKSELDAKKYKRIAGYICDGLDRSSLTTEEQAALDYILN